jgi:hypothetical protein
MPGRTVVDTTDYDLVLIRKWSFPDSRDQQSAFSGQLKKT